MRIGLFCTSLLLVAEIFATEKPWWTGTLLSANTNPIAVGSSLALPFIADINTYGAYGKDWQFSGRQPIYSIKVGIGLWTGIYQDVDVGFYAQGFHNMRKNRHYDGFGDCSIQFRYLIAAETKCRPAMCIIFRETFPTGNYHHLDPTLIASDEVGSGAYISTLALISQHLRLDFKKMNCFAMISG